MLMFHPAIAVLFVLLPGTVMIVVFSTILDPGENYETYKDQIAIIGSEIVFGDAKSGPTVDVMGTIKNTSPVSWKEIQFHVDFYDAAGRRVDVGEKKQYDFYLPANGTSSFKVSFLREFAETNYAKEVVRVTTAKDAKAKW